MKIIIAPDSFKESMTAAEAGQAMESAVLRVFPEADVQTIPVGDGGEGTLETLLSAAGGFRREATVTGPMGEPVRASYGILGDGETAVVEMAQASGLQRVLPGKRDPLIATTYGTGELIRAALAHGVKRLVVTIGGSATNDGGAGILQALGAALTDERGNPIGFGSGALHALHRADLSALDSRLQSAVIRVACDVSNPLLGERGASRVFGPQKGADGETIELLESNMRHYAEVMRKETGIALDDVPGAGAGGGIGAALLLLGGEFVSGIDLVLDTLSFDERKGRCGFRVDGGRQNRRSNGRRQSDRRHREKSGQCGRSGAGIRGLRSSGLRADAGMGPSVRP
ncbi:Glycerate 2-kinase [Paenibacillus sp. CECT 9249]|nr:glycerate kinase [Paenibacillus sp. CECT 9249]CAH0119288.1 Glycerate 2-kinase [Paenibacillus sp. CECT 9249]